MFTRIEGEMIILKLTELQLKLGWVMAQPSDLFLFFISLF
jgi:hypothetical protein